MRDDHVVDELSAYLDGESADPARVKRHVGECAQCARRFEELKTLSARLRELPEPEVDPAFAMRVLDAVAKAPLAERRAERVRFGVSLAAATAAVVMLVMAGWLVYRPAAPREYSPPSESLREGTPHAAALAAGDQAALLDALGRVLEGGQGGAVWEAAEPFSGWSAADEPDGDEWLDVLAGDDWFAAVAASLDEDTDVDTLLATLEEGEASALEELLNENAAT